MIGHDCGHTTFSNYPWVNAICGHLCHAPLMVPFWPWAKSHNEHHKYHNHVEKDMSYPWFGTEQYEKEVTPLTKLWLKLPFHPVTSYFFTYLLAGWYDGSHFNPFGKLYRVLYYFCFIYLLVHVRPVVGGTLQTTMYCGTVHMVVAD